MNVGIRQESNTEPYSIEVNADFKGETLIEGRFSPFVIKTNKAL